MKCKPVNRQLLKLSPDELNRLDSSELARHINSCPACHASWQLYKEVSNDLTDGAQFAPTDEFWEGWQSPAKSTGQVAQSWLNRFLHRLDWIIAPERSMRWAGAMTVIVFSVFGGFNLQQRMTAEQQGLPNRLITNSQFIGVMDSHKDGMSLLRRAPGKSVSSASQTLNKGV